MIQLGSEQAITAGAMNRMAAERGIAHSVRTSPEEKDKLHSAHGLQSWIALPKAYEEMPPEFHHHPDVSFPEWAQAGVTLKLVAGSAYGYEAPVTIYSPMFDIEVTLERIAQAKGAWKAGLFDKVPGDEIEFISLPE